MSSDLSKEAELFCEIENPNQNKYIIYINSEFMGLGDDDLGQILIKGFINTIEEMKTLPTHIIFVNGAVKITTEDSSETQTLKKLEKKGVKISTCGTCLNFFELSEKLRVGIASNMFDIMKLLTESPKIVTP
jgi:selenium metabolism protein YedF